MEDKFIQNAPLLAQRNIDGKHEKKLNTQKQISNKCLMI